MSKQIDEHIVEMRFNNSDFDKNAMQTIKTLQDLKGALEIDAEGTNLESLNSSVKSVTQNFSVLEEVAKGALWQIGNQAVIAGENLLKSFTVDQMTSGWSKFEEKTRAVQTIMSATGDSIDEVNGYLEKLMWFTDETSYNFVDMTSNIGKFTSQGVKLDKATDAMIGIANWAALAGQGANEASRAMYNLAQSLGAGYVKYQDWMSVINANMDIVSFKEQVIETAKALGTLDSAGKTLKGSLVTVENFNEALTSDAWFTKDVLISVLNDYASFSNAVYDEVQETGESAAEAMANLSGQYADFAEKAFRAGQEAKTFSDVLDATNDAVSSAWAATYEIIFGNYPKAKQMWTDLANSLYDLFAEPVWSLNELLEEWDELGGRDELLDALTQAGHNLLKVLDLLASAWDKAFPELTATRLFEMTRSFKELMQNLELTDFAYENLSDALAGFLSLVRASVRIIGAFVKGITGIATDINGIIGGFIGLAGAIGRYLTAASEAIVTNENLQAITDTVSFIVRVLSDGIYGLAQLLAGFGDVIFTAFSKLDFSMKNGITGFNNFMDALYTGLSNLTGVDESSPLFSFFQRIGPVMENAKNKISSVLKTIDSMIKAVQGTKGSGGKFFEALTNMGKNFSDSNLGASLGHLGDSVAYLTNELATGLEKIEPFGQKVNDVLKFLMVGVRTFVDYIWSRLQELSAMDLIDSSLIAAVILLMDRIGVLLKGSTDALKALKDVFAPFNDVLKEAQNTLKTFQSQIKSKTLTEIAKALLILSGALFIMAAIPFEKLLTGTTALIALGAMLAIVSKQINGLVEDKEGAEKLIKTAKAMSAIGVAIGVAASALAKIGKLNVNELAAGLFGVTALLLELTMAAKALDGVKLNPASMVGLVGFSAAILALVPPLAALSLIPSERLQKGLLSVVALVSMMGAFTKVAGNAEHMLGVGAGIVAMSAGIIALTGAIAILGAFKMETLVQGIGALGAVLLELSGAMFILSKAGGSGAAGAAGIAILSAGLATLIPQILLLGAIPMSTLGQGIMGFGAALAILAGAMGLLSLAGPGVLMVGGAFAALGVGIAAVVASIAGLLTSLPLAAAGIAAFALLSEEQITKASENLVTLFDAVLTAILSVKAKFKLVNLEFWSVMIDTLGEIAPHLANGIGVLVHEILVALNEWAPPIFEEILKLLYWVKDELARPLGEIAVGVVGQFFLGVLDALAAFGEDFYNWIDDLMDGALTKLIEGVKSWAGDLWDSAVEVGKNIVKGIKEGIGNLKKLVFNEGKEAGNAAIEGMKEGADVHSPSKAATEIGENVGQGAFNGLKSLVGKLKGAATDAGSSMLQGLKDGAFGKSGSGGSTGGSTGVSGGPKETGMTFMEQIGSSIKAGTPAVASKASEAGTKTAKSFGTAAKEQAKEEVDELVEEINKQLADSKKLEEAAANRAKAIVGVFETEFKKLDLRLSEVGREFNIFEAIQNPDEKNRDKLIQDAKLIKMQKELNIQAEAVKYAYDRYMNTLNLVGAESVETMEQYDDYLEAKETMTKTASELAAMNHEISQNYLAADEEFRSEIFELQRQQAAMMKNVQVEESQATKDAYAQYLAAQEEDMKNFWFSAWKDLKNQDLENAGIPKIDAEGLRRDIYKEAGLDPDNPFLGIVDVQKLIDMAMQEATVVYDATTAALYPTVLKAYDGVMDQIIDGTEEHADAVDNPAMKHIGTRMADSMGDGISGEKATIKSKTDEVVQEAINGATGHNDDWIAVGEGMMNGLIKGIEENRSRVINAAVDVALAALAAAKAALGIASPSKEFLSVGMYAMEGMALGIKSYSANAIDASSKAAEDTLTPFADIGERVKDLLDSEIDPIITPILDMSNIEKNVDHLNQLWTDKSYQVAGDIKASEATRLARMQDMAKRPPQQVTYNSYYTQNNTSPKALSAIDIYRQTKRQLERGAGR